MFTGEQEGRNWLVNGKVFPEMCISGMDLSVVWIKEKVSDGRYLQGKNRGANDGYMVHVAGLVLTIERALLTVLFSLSVLSSLHLSTYFETSLIGDRHLTHT